MNDRRQVERHPIFLEIAEFNGQPQAGTYLLNISESGAKLETPLALSPGEAVEFSFFLPGEKTEVRRRGQIVWSFPAPLKPGRYRLGLQFYMEHLD